MPYRWRVKMSVFWKGRGGWDCGILLVCTKFFKFVFLRYLKICFETASMKIIASFLESRFFSSIIPNRIMDWKRKNKPPVQSQNSSKSRLNLYWRVSKCRRFRLYFTAFFIMFPAAFRNPPIWLRYWRLSETLCDCSIDFQIKNKSFIHIIKYLRQHRYEGKMGRTECTKRF